jgi:hypothetical protein
MEASSLCEWGSRCTDIAELQATEAR